MKRGAGFTFIELLTVLVILGLTLSVAAFSFHRYLATTSAKRAAEMFGQDLVAARSTALRSKQRVTVDFDEAALIYVIRVEGGDTLFHRTFDPESTLTLSGLDLQLAGDTVAFDRRGIADLRGAAGSLGRALFTAGEVCYTLSFNSLGSSRVTDG